MSINILNKQKLIIESPSENSISDDKSNNSISSESNTQENMLGIAPKKNIEHNYDIKNDFEKLKCNEENYYSTNCNKFILKKELVERNYLSEHEKENPYLYPDLNDKNFNIKIAIKKEFNDTKYDGTIHKNIKEQADILAKAEFELSPNQLFVKNFLSFQTPYNSLLLFHGLGSGKTCSAIGVCEETRDYMKQMGINKRIIIVASENVQDNFKLQLFDERKLKLIDGLWNIKGCVGNKLLKEINPMNMKGIPREKIINQIKTIINNNYLFLGYVQFANYIIRTINYDEEIKIEKKRDTKKGNIKKKRDTEKGYIANPILLKENQVTQLNKRMLKRLKNEFDNRLIVIDEVHNIRKTEDNENKKVAINLELLVKAAENMRLLFLSATPMYNSYKEIVWLLNIMNINDRRGIVEAKDIFDKEGNFKSDGEELLIRKCTGYISFVRGENPYTFPYRVYPKEFAPDKTFNNISYPKYQMNGKKIKTSDRNRILSLYLNKIGNCNKCGECQYCAYKYIIYNLKNKKMTITTKKGVVRVMPSFENMESFGYTLLQTPLESLIISYPNDNLKYVINNLPRETHSKEYEEPFVDTPEKLEEVKINPRLIIESPEESSEESPEESSEESPEESPEESILESENTENSEKYSEQNISDLHEDNIKIGGDVSSPISKDIYIDPHQLTGKIGLESVMNYVDSRSPPQKGLFEYKKSTLNKYGKIFNSELIGKYSSKIKSVIDNIVSPTGIVSEGILLIYSQYIDSGLIPMALALEELGFTRFGKDAKPLFKTKPSEIVDVRTFKPPKNKKDFIPARYSMITGDIRLSPDNDYEVKSITNDDNKNGEKIKVILISKAGSEGIDFKFIRQLHILEPWYNMNLIEQIIGRAVRNFSHKELPFEKRNTQIFMYGTILEDNEDEAADLYVFRVAEHKAIQIGNITRLLKETSVDCIINHDQTNFTQEIINANIDEEITQELSTGTVIHNFKIGDAPFSPACDYMPTCDYKCRPNKDINENELNEDTYNEKFIFMNSDKILQKIRLLMKEEFFYKKENLINLIQIPKKYPLVQIYSALTQLIEDKNEFITDKYGRTGRLINIEEYYLFQPLELRYNNSSIYDRSVPIDYKHSMTVFNINQDIIKPVIDKTNISNILLEEEPLVEVIGNKLLNELKLNFDLAIEFTKGSKVPRGDDNWYKHAGIVMKKMAKEKILIEKLLQYLVDHILDLLLYNEKYEILNYIYSLTNIKKNTFEWFIKEYFEKNSITTKNFTAIILYKLNKRIILILNEDNKWIEAGPEDERELAESQEAKKILIFNKEKYNKIVGFIGYEKSNRYLIFKTKDMDSKRDTGARCDEAGKIKTIDILNKIVGEDKYTKETTKLIKDKDGNVIQEAIGQTELCVIQEFTLRYYDDIKKDNNRWFLTPELAIFHKLYNIIIK